MIVKKERRKKMFRECTTEEILKIIEENDKKEK